MKALIQRVQNCSVTINDICHSQIGHGFLVLLGVEKGDSSEKSAALAKKIANLRIFNDENEKMNLNIMDVHGEIMVVSQFTLAADTSHGNRPGFSLAAEQALAKELYEETVAHLKDFGIPVQTGVFQADMQVALINDGPATFLLEK